jgi:signal peptidase I
MKNKDSIQEVSISGKILVELLQAVHEKGANFCFKATGRSMRPSIHNNDLLTLSPLKEMLPFPGEVVGFRHPRTRNLIVHRIIKADKKGYTIRGDNLTFQDSEIPREHIIGVVTRVERKGKTIFWPNRIQNRIRARIYFRFYLIYLMNRRFIKKIRHFLFKVLKIQMPKD